MRCATRAGAWFVCALVSAACADDGRERTADTGTSDARDTASQGGDSDTGGAVDGAGDDGADDSTGPEVIGSSMSGDWEGTTSQGKPLVFRVTGSVIDYVRFGYLAEGSSCDSEGTTVTGAAAPITGQVFTVEQTGTPPVSLSWTLAGTFSSDDRAAGDLTVILRQTLPGAACSADATATWEAGKLGPPASYDGTWQGTTAEGMPIAFSVTGNRITAMTLPYAIESPDCEQEGEEDVVPEAAEIVARAAMFSFSVEPVSFSVFVEMSSDTSAAGTLEVDYFDTSTDPWCTGRQETTFSAMRL